MATTLVDRNTLVSNHSYGLNSDGAPIWNAGAYTSSARSVDALVFTSEFYLPFFAAGNERNNNPQWNPDDSGYDLINGKNSAKNVVTVGAVNSVSNYTGPTSVVMSSFSSWGPTDDGRIKPDVVAKGVNVRSTIATSNTASGVQQGTSMACPAAAGVGLLLQQHYMNLNQDQPMLAATLKGLILHTADEAGFADGPDYQFGWGLINAEKAANVLTTRGQTSVVKELILQNNATYTTTVQVGSAKPLVASISWTDRAPASNTVNSGTVDLQTLMLVNDLDVKITKGSEVYFPWTLDPANPSYAATNLSENVRDNFEKIEIALPEQGVYTISIKHKRTLVGLSQKFSLIVTGDSVVELNNASFSENDIKVYPNPATNSLNVISTNVEIESYEIYDVQGRMINSNLFSSSNQVDISQLQSGMYLIKLISQYGQTVKRFVKN
jgi:hypothetical protein